MEIFQVWIWNITDCNKRKGCNWTKNWINDTVVLYLVDSSHDMHHHNISNWCSSFDSTKTMTLPTRLVSMSTWMAYQSNLCSELSVQTSRKMPLGFASWGHDNSSNISTAHTSALPLQSLPFKVYRSSMDETTPGGAFCVWSSQDLGSILKCFRDDLKKSLKCSYDHPEVAFHSIDLW